VHEKACGTALMATNRPLANEKSKGARKKILANLWGRQRITKITKKIHAERGLETKWEMSV
jgi:hypothetical protein